VLASAVGGSAQVLRHGGNGLLFAPGRREELRALLRGAAAGDYDLAALGAAARAGVVAEFSMSALAAELTALYRE
jgi:glycosyltransferase involved in cell wall biosynthesis